MSIKILETTNLLNEAFYILNRIASNTDDYKIERNLSKKYKDDESYLNKLDLITSTINDIKYSLKPNLETIAHYFINHENVIAKYATLAYLWHANQLVDTTQSAIKYIYDLKAKERIFEFAEILDQEQANALGEENLATLTQLIKFINNININPEDKWCIIDIIVNQSKHLDILTPIIDKTITIINKHMVNFKPYLDERQIYWQNIEEQHGLINLIEEKKHIKWEHTEISEVVCLSIFNPQMISIKLDAFDESVADYITLGFCLNDSFIKNDMSDIKEDVYKFVKILSDKSKLDILEYLSREANYGKAIAKELGLTTPTISYHMNALSAAGFVSTSEDSNRVYYTLDKESINNQLENINQYFKSMIS